MKLNKRNIFITLTVTAAMRYKCTSLSVLQNSCFIVLGLKQKSCLTDISIESFFAKEEV
jgi:hypothetical protein